MELIKRIVGAVVFAGVAIFAGFRLALDFFSVTTLPDDLEVAGYRLNQLATFILEIPAWLVFIAVIIVAIILIVSPYIWPSRSQTVGATDPVNPVVADGVDTPDSGQSDRPHPTFLCPRQAAGEHNLSWWHIPVTLNGPGGSPPVELRHCTVELFGPDAGKPPISLRWQADNEPKGTQECALVEGMERLVPLALRHDPNDSEPKAADGFARITGTAFLRDGILDKFPQPRGVFDFRLRVKCGLETWESEKYRLKVPGPHQGNSGFVLEAIPALY